MLERQSLQIEIIGEPPKKRDYCILPKDKKIQKSINELLSMEEELASGKLKRERWDEVIVSHIRYWNNLPDYYKGELSDLIAMEMQP